MKPSTKQKIYENIFKIIVVDFPKLFNPIAPTPLASVVKSQLHYHYDKKLSPECIHLFLGVWTNRIEYHRAVLQHSYRLDLLDKQTELTDSHKTHALKSIQAMLRP